ncbi:hypothetical protein GCM10009868_36210 [Terrabacter aerolatus]
MSLVQAPATPAMTIAATSATIRRGSIPQLVNVMCIAPRPDPGPRRPVAARYRRGAARGRDGEPSERYQRQRSGL